MYIQTLEGLGQGPTALTRCGTDTDDVDVKFRAFIPSPAASLPVPVPAKGTGPVIGAVGGDNRGYSYQSRNASRNNPCLRPAATHRCRQPSVVDRRWGTSTGYRAGDVLAVPGLPVWYLAIKAGATPVAIEPGKTTVDNLKIAFGGTSFRHNAYALASKSTVLSLHADAALPLVPGAPAINADLNLYLKREGDVLRCLVCGDHDGFPAYELYVNGVLVYCYDPIAGGKAPSALFPPSDIEVNTRWIDIQLATGQILSGQICKGSVART